MPTDFALFWDFGSLFQAPRTPEQQRCFQAALNNMSMWYAHSLTTVFLLPSDERCASPRAARGWPFYEEALSRLLKDVLHYRWAAACRPDFSRVRVITVAVEDT